MEPNIVSVSILEKDIFNKVLNVWSYPDSFAQEILVTRSFLNSEQIPIRYSYSKFQNNWIYILIQLNDEKQKLPQTEVFATCIVATEFNPEKYADFAKILSEIYLSTGSPLGVLKAWISVFARGKYSEEQKNFAITDYDFKTAIMVTSIKDIISMFGEEIIILWTALIMKKRIFVISEKIGPLLKMIRGFPLFVFHRQAWDILRPFMTLSETEITDLKTTGVYIAGFVDESAKDREDLYDILVDMNNRSISIASHARTYFGMTSIQKDICKFLLEKSEDAEANDSVIIKELIVKTKQILGKLEQLKSEHEDGTYVDMKSLSELPPNMDTLLYNIAAAEGMTKM